MVIMPACKEAAHCSVGSAGACLAGNFGGGGSYAGFGGFGYRSPVLLGSVAHTNVSGDSTFGGPVYVRTITLRDWGPQRNRPVQSLEPEHVEQSLREETLGERLMRLVRPIHEPFKQRDFVQKAGEFLASIGVVHVASLEVDGNHVHVYQTESSADFRSVAAMADAYFDSHPSPARQIVLKLFGRNNYFFLEMILTYRPVHSPHEPALSVAIGATPVALHTQDGETLDEYSQRTEKLRTDPATREAFEKELEEKARDLVSDLSYHISSTFPGARFSVVEQDETAETF